MSRERNRPHFNDLQSGLRDIALKKASLKNVLRDFIFSFQMIDSRVQKTLFIARNHYIKQRYYYKVKINNLRQKKRDIEKLYTRYINKKEKLKIPKLDENTSKSIGNLKYTLKELKFRINSLNSKLEGQILDIDTENEISERLLLLQDEEKQKTKKLLEFEKHQENILQNSEYYKTLRNIEDLELKLTEIYSQLKKWSIRLVKTHKKMFKLYRITKEFENFKKKITELLIDNKNVTNYYNQLFADLMKENNDNLLQELISLEKRKRVRKKVKEKTPADIQYLIDKKRETRKYLKEKLAIALEKQKAGKRLNFYEMKLILENTEN